MRAARRCIRRAAAASVVASARCCPSRGLTAHLVAKSSAGDKNAGKPRRERTGVSQERPAPGSSFRVTRVTGAHRDPRRPPTSQDYSRLCLSRHLSRFHGFLRAVRYDDRSSASVRRAVLATPARDHRDTSESWRSEQPSIARKQSSWMADRCFATAGTPFYLPLWNVANIAAEFR